MVPLFLGVTLQQTADTPSSLVRMMQLRNSISVNVGPLAPETLNPLIRHFLGLKGDVPDDVMEYIQPRAQGFSMFAQELCIGLLESKTVVIKDGEIESVGDLSLNAPIPTLMSVIQSGINRLPNSTQMAMKIASVIGEEFSLVLLRNVYPIEEEVPLLKRHLILLEKKAFIRKTHQVNVYTFISPLIHEAAYSLLLFKQRLQLHEKLATFLQDSSHETDDPIAVAHMVAYHWVKLLDSYDPNSQPPFETLKKAICSLCDAGALSSRQYSIREAARYFNSGGHFLGEVNRRKDQPDYFALNLIDSRVLYLQLNSMKVSSHLGSTFFLEEKSASTLTTVGKNKAEGKKPEKKKRRWADQ